MLMTLFICFIYILIVFFSYPILSILTERYIANNDIFGLSVVFALFWIFSFPIIGALILGKKVRNRITF